MEMTAQLQKNVDAQKATALHLKLRDQMVSVTDENIKTTALKK